MWKELLVAYVGVCAWGGGGTDENHEKPHKE
jgi:hypothetical protein